MLYVGKGSEGEQCHLLHSLSVFSRFPCYPQANWALLLLIPGWAGLCTFKDLVGLSNELSCEARSFSHCRFNPHRCFQSEALRLYFPALEPWVAQSVLLPSCSSLFICTRMWDYPVHKLPPCLLCQPPPCSPQSSSCCFATSPLHLAAHLRLSYQAG